MTNPIIEAMLNRKSIRKYTDETPSEDVIRTIARAAQQAPFAAQFNSLLLTRDRAKHPFHAPLLFTVCVDCYKMERIMAKRDWQIKSNSLILLLFGLQDASLMAENLVMAAESFGMGSCFLGLTPKNVATVRERYKLPQRVFPVVGLAVGYPAEDPPPRPRYPMDFFLFEDTYPEFTDEQIARAMTAMDEGYMAQDYYKQPGLKIPIEDDREDTFTFDDYGWTEHISRKWGQWFPTVEPMLEELRKCGFDIRSGQQQTAESE